MEEKDKQNPNNSSSSSFVIKIPSYEEVIQSSQSKTPLQSLFNPSQSFSQAFKSIKNTEFYAPPPPLPAPVPPSLSSTPSQQSGVDATPSSSPLKATNSTVVSSSSTQNRKSILVSHRQIVGSGFGQRLGKMSWYVEKTKHDILIKENEKKIFKSG